MSFKCRVCGHDEYEAIYDTSPFDTFGSSIQPVHYVCKRCSVLFKDFDKFSDTTQPKSNDFKRYGKDHVPGRLG